MTRTPRRRLPRARPAMQLSPAGLVLSIGRALLIVASLYYVVAYLAVAVARSGYPYELEWLEGAILEQVRRVARGDALYVAPTPDYVPLNYGPLYFWIAGAIARVMGAEFLALRLLSLVSSLGMFALLFDLVRRETRSVAAGWISVGLFAATYRLGGGWLDLARVDSLSLAILLAGVWVLRVDRAPRRAGILSGLLFVLAFLAKQSSATLVVPVVLWVLFTDPARGVPLLATLAVAGAGSVAALNRATHGWFRYYAFEVARRHPMDPTLVWSFPVRDVLVHLAPGVAVAAFAAARERRWWWSRAGGFYAALIAGWVGTAWLLRLYRGGHDNVLITAHMALALAAGLALAVPSAGTPRDRWAAWLPPAFPLVLLVQLALVWWDPMKMIPTPADRSAWSALVADMRRKPGTVFMPSHPYLAVRVGHPSRLHVMPFMDVVKGGKGPVEVGLFRALRDSLYAHRYPAIVLDERDWLIEEAQRAGYRAKARAFTDPDVAWPVAGMRTRPGWILMPVKPPDSTLVF